MCKCAKICPHDNKFLGPNALTTLCTECLESKVDVAEDIESKLSTKEVEPLLTLIQDSSVAKRPGSALLWLMSA